MDGDWAFLTPSFLHTLRPEEIRCLDTLLQIGEVVSQIILEDRLEKGVHVINGYGLAETCEFCPQQERRDEALCCLGQQSRLANHISHGAAGIDILCGLRSLVYPTDHRP
jgi:hypothetical protein